MVMVSASQGNAIREPRFFVSKLDNTLWERKSLAPFTVLLQGKVQDDKLEPEIFVLNLDNKLWKRKDLALFTVLARCYKL